MSNRIEIVYCTQCRWLLRAAWMAQELLSTFDQEISELTLKPGTGGIFEVYANGKLVWSRKAQRRFPEITELKQLVRDEIAPGHNLGHADRKKKRKAERRRDSTFEHEIARPRIRRNVCGDLIDRGGDVMRRNFVLQCLVGAVSAASRSTPSRNRRIRHGPCAC